MRVTVLFLVSCVAFAQNRGSIAGTVSDPDGIALSKAAIQATNSATKAVYKVTSSDDGGYAVALPPGTYELTAQVPGMSPYQRQGVVVAAGQTLRFDIRVEDLASLNTLGDGREFFAALVTPHNTPAGPALRMADGKPDLSGVWFPSLPRDTQKPEPLPWAQALIQERIASARKDSPIARCLPAGVIMFGAFFPFRVVHTPKYLAMISEEDTPNYRQIFLDGRSHPKDPEPTWMGHSVGHWEGDTLVVDSVGFNDKTWLDLAGRVQTEKLHLTERYRRPDLGHLEMKFLIDDPGAYAKPWTVERVSDLAPNEEVQEYICNENNKDVPHMVGK
jgi:hypothetical protein